MKKIYNAPDTILKKVRLQKSILIGSLDGNNLVDTEESVAPEDVEARGTAWTTPRSLWDE